MLALSEGFVDTAVAGNEGNQGAKADMGRSLIAEPRFEALLHRAAEKQTPSAHA